MSRTRVRACAVKEISVIDHFGFYSPLIYGTVNEIVLSIAI